MQISLGILDKNHAISITNCLTTFEYFQYTGITGDSICHENNISK